MANITSSTYRQGLYNYLVPYENAIPRFYLDAGLKNTGNLTGGAGIMMYKTSEASGNASFLLSQLSGATGSGLAKQRWSDGVRSCKTTPPSVQTDPRA